MVKRMKSWLCIGIVVALLTGCRTTGENNTSSANGAQTTSNVSANFSTVDYKEIDSEALGKKMSVNIYLPAGYDRNQKYPVLYLIHGFGGSQYDWLNSYSASTVYDDLIKAGTTVSGIIVCPEIENSYGVNSFDGPAKDELITDGNDSTLLNYGRYEDYIMKDLISYVEKNYGASTKKEDRYIGGFSMGGHVALRLAFTYPEMFSKVGGHAPSLRQEKVEMSPMIQKMVYPTQALREQRDPLFLAKKVDLKDLSVYLDIGSEDMPEKKLQLATEDLFKTLQELKVKSVYSLNEGTHDGAYIKSNVNKYLTFYFGK